MDPEKSIITNQAPEGVIYTILVVKWSLKLKGLVDNIDYSLCGGLCKKLDGSLVPLPGTDLDAKMNGFTWLKEENDRIVLEDY